jgi:hypothetical protein
MDDGTRRAYGHLSDSFECLVGFYLAYFLCQRHWGHGAVSLAALLMMGGKLALLQGGASCAVALIVLYGHNRDNLTRRLGSGLLWMLVVVGVAVSAWRALPLPNLISERAAAVQSITVTSLQNSVSHPVPSTPNVPTTPPISTVKELGLLDCMVEIFKSDCNTYFTNRPGKDRFTIFAAQALSTFYMRLISTGAALAMVKEYPWQGVGFNQSTPLFQEYARKDILHLKERVGIYDSQIASVVMIDTPLPSVAAELGWVGLAINIIMILSLAGVGVLAVWRVNLPPSLVAAASWVITMPLVNQSTVWFGPANVLLLWQMLMTGLVVCWLKK